MTLDPEIALAASARNWPDRFHRFLLDHGGGRVRARVMGAEQALAAEFEVLLIDDVCSFLTPRLVRRIREQGREVIGVFSPGDGPDAKRRLLECGISDVVEEDAEPEEFLRLIAATVAHRLIHDSYHRVEPRSGFRIGVRSAATGSGCTEVALALAGHLAKKGGAVLIDLDQFHPGVAQRIGIPLHPNLRTAVDLAHHDPSRLGEAIHHVEDLEVIGGVAVPALSDPVPASEISGLLEDLTASSPLVLDLGDSAVASQITSRVTLLVAEASPVGITRLIRRVEREFSAASEDLLVVVNRVPGGGRFADDVRAELAKALPDVPCALLAEDRRVGRAAWNGTLVMGGPFARRVRQIADLIGTGARVDR